MLPTTADASTFRDDFRDVAIIARSAHDLADQHGIHFTPVSEEGLGDALVATATLDHREQVVLVQYLQAARPYREQVHIRLLHRLDPAEQAMSLDHVLEKLRLRTSDLSWLAPELSFTPHALWRQDDHGSRFQISVFPSRSDASFELLRFEQHPHKQLYWVCPA